MACAGPDRDLPGVVAMVVDKNGDQVFAHAAGQRGHGHDHLGPMQIDTLFWTASCTNLITGIACMQLVERGVLTLDDTEIVQRHCPELRHVRVLQPDGRLVEKQRDITLRMLLSHTAGFGYSFIDANLRDHNRPAGYNEFSGQKEDFLQPLIHQPGEAWEYGLLSRETVDEMFRNQIPHLAPLNGKHMPAAKPELTTAVTGLQPTVDGDRQGWGLTFLLSGGDTGRSIGTAQWTGLPNLRWCCDRENGVAGIFCAQILPFGDLKAFTLAEEIERQVYEGLSEARRGRPC
ncbi:hypothetical protein AnigIFM62618_004832 [Aspergillus niger]|nr:hypothetical protein AnigIFM62618_004832 [Aspergillus niger]